MAPPSNQQQVAPRPGAPRDYREHTNADLLASPLPASSALVLERDQIKSSGSASRRPKARDPFVSQSQDEDEEEDEFETDTRPVDKGKRAAISESMPPPKRPRVAPTEPPPTASIASHVRSTLPRAPHSSQVPQPTQADLETLKRAKIEVSQRARYQLTSSAKQRHVWSHHDCALLIQLIRERHAAWATMEHNDNDKFEHPRNQQAYRDKARNMKVDYLMTDAIMPPCFDLVALGKKEIDRLISLGKNPYRKESDIDADGQAAADTNANPSGPMSGKEKRVSKRNIREPNRMKRSPTRMQTCYIRSKWDSLGTQMLACLTYGLGYEKHKWILLHLWSFAGASRILVAGIRIGL
ncbi:SANT SWI3, ADA2, N-coR and TFIIIB'' DNA-binding domain-containing protein [Ilyonectria robusta]